MNRLTTALSLFILVILAGCSAPQPQHHMQLGAGAEALAEQQMFNPQASEENGTQIHGSLDGPTGVKILSTYRSDISKPQEVRNEIQVNIGN
ncbi:hypothetical protein KDX31_06050 [Amphritea atlantica]|uniref:Lipoprotein n=1 Tax=Amphritea atlantica TaxID=355243 RepID=A0ABY5GYQ7_9GAMM|nr:hypothetical protein KDX31_06050 [Amphritea atlantica]